MSKKKPTSTDPRIAAFDNPTAGFPIGTLAGLGEQRTNAPDPADESDFETAATELRRPVPELDPSPLDPALHRREAVDVSPRVRKPELPPPDPEEPRAHPALLALSLLVGVVLAVALVTLIGLFLLVG